MVNRRHLIYSHTVWSAGRYIFTYYMVGRQIYIHILYGRPADIYSHESWSAGTTRNIYCKYALHMINWYECMNVPFIRCDAGFQGMKSATF